MKSKFKYKVGENLIFYQVTEGVYNDYTGLFIHDKMKSYIGKVGCISECYQQGYLPFYEIYFDNIYINTQNVNLTQNWIIYENDLKPLRELKLERIMK